MNLLQTTPIATTQQGSLNAAGLVRFRGALHALVLTAAETATDASSNTDTQSPCTATATKDLPRATGITPSTQARLLRQEATDGGWLEASSLDLPIGSPSEARLQQTPNGDLILLAQGQMLSQQRTLVTGSDDGRHWQRPRPLGEAGHSLHQLAWLGKKPQSIATDREGSAHWYSLGQQLRAGQATPIPALEGQRLSGAALALNAQGRAYCLLARDNPDPAHSDALFGWADTPYQDWHWRRLGINISEPCLIWNTRGDALYAGYRRHAQPGYWQPHWVEISELDLTGARQRRCALPPADASGTPSLLLDGQRLRCLYQADIHASATTALQLAEIDLASSQHRGLPGSHHFRLPPLTSNAEAGTAGMGIPFSQLMNQHRQAHQSPSLQLYTPAGKSTDGPEHPPQTQSVNAKTSGANRGRLGIGSTTGNLGVLGRLRQPNCWRCRHFQVTWDEGMPYGCRRYAFKSRLLPSMEVMLADGQPCLGFQAKAADTNTDTG